MTSATVRQVICKAAGRVLTSRSFLLSQPFTPYILFKIPPPHSFHRMIALAFCTLSAKFSAYLRLCVCLLALLEGNHPPTPNWEQSLNNTDSVPFTSGDLKSGCV